MSRASAPQNSAVEQTAGSHSLAAAAHRDRSAHDREAIAKWAAPGGEIADITATRAARPTRDGSRAKRRRWWEARESCGASRFACAMSAPVAIRSAGRRTSHYSGARLALLASAADCEGSAEEG